MGFSEEAAAAALAAADGDVAAAAEALTEAGEEGGRASGSGSPEVVATSGNVMESASAELGQLVGMGFPHEAAAAALAASGGDVAKAAEALLESAGTSKVKKGTSKREAAAVDQRQPAKAQLVEERSALARISNRAKAAVVSALAGPDGSYAGRVERSIRRGRVALRDNLWAKHEDDARLETLSPCYAKLKPYQKAAVRWLVALSELGLGGILADEMGLGKTAETLAFLDVRRRMHLAGGKRPGSGAPGSEPPDSEESTADGAEDGECMKPSLVVVPASLLGNWTAEVKTWCPHFRAFQYYSASQADRLGLVDEYFAEHHGRCSLILTTPGILSSKADRATFFRRVDFDYLIYDEAHGVKNAGAQRFKDIYRGLQVGHRLLLTGTPVQNSLRELGNLLALLLTQTTETSGGSKKCRRDSHAAVEELSDLVERGVLRTLQVRAAPFILRRLKRDVMKDLPPKTGQTAHCILTANQKDAYNSELAKARAEAARASAAKARRDFVKHLFHRLRRVCNHPLLGQSKLADADYEQLVEALRKVRPDFARAAPAKALAEVRGWSDYEVASAVRDHGLTSQLGPKFQVSKEELLEGSTKIQELVKLLRAQKEAKRKTLVFSQFTQFLDLISDVLGCLGIKFARLDGGTNIGERPEIVRNFQDPTSGLDVFLLSTKAGGVGLNLTAADCVVLMDLSFNPHDNRQAEDRVHRLGQSQPVNVHYLVCKGTVEEQVLKINLDKMALDYKFGGQRMLLQAEQQRLSLQQTPRKRADGQDDDEDDDEDEEEEADASAMQREAKKAEQAVLAELERVCSAPL